MILNEYQKTWFDLVFDFHIKYNHAIATKPLIPQDNLIDLRKKLHQEELDELFVAMDEKDLVEIADAIGDLIYVLIGTAITYGIPLDKVFREIHRSNMTKAGKRADGKTIKGPDFEPPQLAKILGLEG